MYNEWRLQQNKNPDQIPIKCDLVNMQHIQKKPLYNALYKFITEITKINGEEYPPKTIYEIIICVQMYLESKGLFWKFFEDIEFVDLKYTCDNIMKERAKTRLGSYVKQAAVLSYDQEEYLWNNGFLGSSNPEQLVKTVLFLVGIHYVLYAGSEHRAL